MLHYLQNVGSLSGELNELINTMLMEWWWLYFVLWSIIWFNFVNLIIYSLHIHVCFIHGLFFLLCALSHADVSKIITALLFIILYCFIHWSKLEVRSMSDACFELSYIAILYIYLIKNRSVRFDFKFGFQNWNRNRTE